MPAHAPRDAESEIRLNRATGEWVVVAPGRSARPGHGGESSRSGRRSLPDHDPSCPFCPGNEAALSAIVEEFPDGRGGWLARAVPNKYPLLTPDGRAPSQAEAGPYRALPGRGRHEVLVETPLHNLDIVDMGETEVKAVAALWRTRYLAAREMPSTAHVVVFRNHGPAAGTSLPHPHSQLVASARVPRQVRTWEEAAARAFDHDGRCPFCAMLEFELEQGERVVLQDEAWAAFVPFAASSACEVWLAPREHGADFGRLGRDQAGALGLALQRLLRALARALDDPDYNLMIHSWPVWMADAPYLHWFVRIVPRLNTPAGFELGAGIPVNPSLPENDAEILRNALASPTGERP